MISTGLGPLRSRIEATAEGIPAVTTDVLGCRAVTADDGSEATRYATAQRTTN